MPGPLPISARLYAEQIPALWRFGPVTLADHTRDDSMAAIARRVLAAAPPHFALAGLSIGGYIAFEIMRQGRERVAMLALLDTGARAETPEQTERRKVVIALAKSGRYSEVPDIAFPLYVHRNRHNDAGLRQTVRMMAAETGVEAFLRQQQATWAGRIRGLVLARSNARRSSLSATATGRRRPSLRARLRARSAVRGLWRSPIAATFRRLNDSGARRLD
jgi:pimeloyl-ACP methyl ester carboxylesterase